MEYLDIVDEQGNPTGQTVERSVAHAQGIRHRTAHVWLLRRRDGVTEVLLQKRSDNKDSYPGCYDISSAGHIPAGVDFIPSALRELGEELGVTATEEELHLCGERRFFVDTAFHGRPFRDRQVSRIYCLWWEGEDRFTLQASEVSAVKWMPLEDCCRGVEQNTFHHAIVLEEILMVRDWAAAQTQPGGAETATE
jgi:isopentenyldiphosphate isomerase